MVNKEDKPVEKTVVEKVLEKLPEKTPTPKVEEAKTPEEKIDAKADHAVEEAIASATGTGEKVNFVFDRDTVLEADVIKDNLDGTKNIRIQGVAQQAMSTSVSSGPGERDFLNVRKGSGRSDVGSFFLIPEEEI